MMHSTDTLASEMDPPNCLKETDPRNQEGQTRMCVHLYVKDECDVYV